MKLVMSDMEYEAVVAEGFTEELEELVRRYNRIAASRGDKVQDDIVAYMEHRLTYAMGHILDICST